MSRKISRVDSAIKKGMNITDNLGSFLYDVGFRICDEKKTTNRAAVYLPTDGSVTFESMNQFFKDEISRQIGIESSLINLITSERATTNL